MSGNERSIHGQRFFDVREKLTRVVEKVRELAQEVGASASALDGENSIKKTLYNPYLFVVCGEVNAGKSSLINALLGSELCPTNVLPRTSRLEWFRWGEEEKDVEVTKILWEQYRNIPYLKDFNIVDTPGTNSVIKGHSAITERFLPVADLALFTFPVNNPWGAATWDFVTRYKDPLKGKMAIILQQKDLRSEAEISIIVNHIKEISRQRLGEVPPIFPISAIQAIHAQTGEHFDRGIWKESGFDALEDFIATVVSNSPSRREALRYMRDSGYEVLQDIEAQVETLTRNLDDKEAFLARIEGEIEILQETTVNEVSASQTELRDVFANEVNSSSKTLKKALSPFETLASLFRKDATPAEVERSLVEAVKNAVEQHAMEDAKKFHAICADHWQGAVQRIVDYLGVSPERLGDGPDMTSVQRRFMWRLGRAARQSVLKLKIRSLLDIHMETRRLSMRRYVVMCLLALCTAGGLGVFGFNTWALSILGLALIFLLIGLIDAQKTGKELVLWFQEKASTSRSSFAKGLSTEYAGGARAFFTEYGEHFAGTKRVLAEQKIALKPKLEKWNELFVDMKTIDQEL